MGLAIEAKDVRYDRQQRPVLCGVNIAVPSGGILCILGPNGAGKTTFLHCLAGIETSWRGGIALLGRDVHGLSRMETARLIALVPQASASLFAYPIEQFVMLGRTPHMALGSSPRAKDHEAVDLALETVGITALRARAVTELSGGERQLAVIARALAQETPVILLDEPTANLDLHNQARVLSTLKRLAESDRTLVITTHLTDHAFLLNSAVALFEQGVISYAGPAVEACTEARLAALYKTPVRVLAAAFTGTSHIGACVPDLGAPAAELRQAASTAPQSNP